MLSAQAEHWLRIAAHMNVARKQGISPHKPLLLLVLAELAEQSKLTNPLSLTGDLTFRFLAYGAITAHRQTQKLDITLPVFHSDRDGIWTALDENGDLALSRNHSAAIQINEEFFGFLHNENFREQLRRVLISKYFVDAAERAALYDLVCLPIPSDEVVQEDSERYEKIRAEGRKSRFKLTVIPAYNYSCALYQFQITTVATTYIVDAAHIHQWSISRNDEPQNGIALSKNAHWAFDEGLWSLDDNYRVLIAHKRFNESGNEALLLTPLQGKQILLPADSKLWPDKNCLHWHRTQRFGKSRKS